MAGKTEIDPGLAEWIRQQPMYFLASAPLSAEGHVNVSPRGLDSLRVLGPRQVALLDLTGSGNETAAHLLENGRITVMFCAFEGRPRILRLFGQGRSVLPGDAEWDELRGHFPAGMPGVRQIFLVDVHKVRTSCGFGVPLMTFQAQRSELIEWAEKKGEDGLRAYRAEKNSRSLDGLPAPGMDDDKTG